MDTDQQMAAPRPPRMGITSQEWGIPIGSIRTPLLPCASVPSPSRVGHPFDHPHPVRFAPWPRRPAPGRAHARRQD
jgi:hypothetical protein